MSTGQATYSSTINSATANLNGEVYHRSGGTLGVVADRVDCANRWMPLEVNMLRHIELLKNPDGLTEVERKASPSASPAFS
jgi:hypothetical protein